MNININIRADSADDYKAAIKALMDGAGMVGFDIPSLTLPAPRSGSVKAQQQADAEELLRKQAAKAQQQATVEAPVPSAGEMPIEAPKPAQTPAAADPNRVVGDWTPGGGKQAEDVPSVKEVTLPDLQAAGRKLALAGGQDKLGAILAKYNVRNLTGLSEQSAETRAQALADLEAANNE